MRILEYRSIGGRDFHATMECEHCGGTQEIKTGYNDAYYHQHVIPAMTCEACGKNRAGEIPAESNAHGLKHVEARAALAGEGEERPGVTRQATCKTCGRPVTETFHWTVAGLLWDIDEHTGPCGHPCLGGGVSHVELRTKRYHGGVGKCPCMRWE